MDKITDKIRIALESDRLEYAKGLLDGIQSLFSYEDSKSYNHKLYEIERKEINVCKNMIEEYINNEVFFKNLSNNIDKLFNEVHKEEIKKAILDCVLQSKSKSSPTVKEFLESKGK